MLDTGRSTQIVIVTTDILNGVQWEMTRAYQLALYLSDIARWNEDWCIKSVYQLELSRTGGTVQPVDYQVLTPDPEQPYAKVLRLELDQQDPIEMPFDATPGGAG